LPFLCQLLDLALASFEFPLAITHLVLKMVLVTLHLLSNLRNDLGTNLILVSRALKLLDPFLQMLVLLLEQFYLALLL